MPAGAAHSLVIEYDGSGVKVKGFISSSATRRALQMVGNGASIEIAIVNFDGTGRLVLPGITERLEYVDAPSHAADPARYRARGYAMAGNRCAIVTDHDADLVEVYPLSRGKVDLSGLTVERLPAGPSFARG